MKMHLVFLALALPFSAQASEAFHGWSSCTGKAGSETVALKFGSFAGGKSAHFSLVDSKHPESPWVFDVDPREIMNATVGWQYATFAHGHHNTLVKLMADGDLFGRPANDEGKNAPFYGKLFLQTGNSETPSKKVFSVTCKNDLLDE